jgi:hypothetical protein
MQSDFQEDAGFVDMQQALHNHQMGRGRNRQKLRRSLHKAENDRIKNSHVSLTLSLSYLPHEEIDAGDEAQLIVDLKLTYQIHFT